jgi:hypothetical protein
MVDAIGQADQPEINFPDKDRLILENQAFHGERASQLRSGEDWKWLNDFIFGAIFDEAIMILRNAKTDEDRIKAQQMFLSVEKPKRQLDFLISQGDAARASLKELQTSTLVNSEEEQNNG